MAAGDGNGWVTCSLGHRHWGRHGAAGLLLLRPGAPATGGTHLLLQLRAAWTHEGGTWGVPGGARDSHETVEVAALREAGEEAGVDAARVALRGAEGRRVGVDHGDWSYTYVVALAPHDLPVGPPTMESEALAWVDLQTVASMPLHPGLGGAWASLLTWLPTLVTEPG